MTTAIQKYLDKAVGVLEKLKIMPSAEESQLVKILEDVVPVDEGKVTAIAKTVRYMSTFNDLVRNKVEDMRVADRYRDITQLFDSIIADSKSLVHQLDDGKLDWKERASNFWMKLVRGTTHHRFEEISGKYLGVSKDTRVQLDRENEILDAYIDFRFALKDAEALAFDVLKQQETILKNARTVLENANKEAVSYKGNDQGEKSRLELKRDEAKRAYEKEDRNYQLIKDVQENLSVGYNIGDVLMAKLTQTHNLKEQVYRRAVTFFTTNEHVFTSLDALFTSQHGLHEATQTVDAMKSGTEKSIEAIAELGREFEKAAIKTGYGATIGAPFAQKLIDAVVAYQTESLQMIEQARKEATENVQQIRAGTELGKRQIAELVTKYLPSPN